MIDPTRIARLAAYAVILRDYSEKFIHFIPSIGDGLSAPFVLGTGSAALTDKGTEFVHMVYDAGWVVDGFNWSEWQGTEECRSLLADRAFLARADEHQVARLLTLLVHRDRFVEGTLIEAFENDLILSIAERAEVLS